ncbi:MAG: methyl-accepting chemotaxis protein, partial [Hyphomicrobiales bacterium]
MKMRLTIKVKLAAAFSLMVVLLLAIAALGLNSLGHMKETVSDIISGPAKRQELGLNSYVAMLESIRAQKNLLLSNSHEEAEKFKADGDAANRQLMAAIEEALQIASGARRQVWLDIKVLATKFVESDTKMAKLHAAGAKDQATELSMGELRTVARDLTQRFRDVASFNQKAMRDADEKATSQYGDTRTMVISIAAVALLAAIGVALWIVLGISRGLGAITRAVQAVAIGDLDQRIEVKSNDEIKDLVTTVNQMTGNLRTTAGIAEKVAEGDLTVQPKPLSEQDTLGIALQSMVDRLRGVVGDALAAADNVSSGSQQLSSASEQVSQGATEQAASAEEASASMEEMAANIKQNADNAAQTEKIARQSSKDAESSGEAVTRAVNAMRTIAEKISIVQEIARQTDL